MQEFPEIQADALVRTNLQEHSLQTVDESTVAPPRIREQIHNNAEQAPRIKVRLEDDFQTIAGSSRWAESENVPELFLD